MAESDDDSAPVRIDKTIAELGDGRAETLNRMRKLIREADPAVIGTQRRGPQTSWTPDQRGLAGTTFRL